MIEIKDILNNYDTYLNELQADLCLLRGMLQQDMGEPGASLTELSFMLKHLRCCSEFTNDAVIDMRLEHAELRLRQLSLAEWAIHSRQERQRLILQGLYVEGKSWQELQDELHVSQTTISRERNKALASIQNELETWPEFRKPMLESRK